MQAPQAIQGISVFRPDEYRLSPEFKTELVSSALQKYRMVVDPLSFDEPRASFSLRAPGQGVILSNSSVYIECRWLIKIPGACEYDTMMGATCQPVSTRDIAAQDTARADETYRMGYAPKVAFSQGDGFGKSISNIQISVNGASISNSRLNLYKTMVDKCWMSDDVFATRFSGCGGRYNDYRVQPISGQADAVLSTEAGNGVLAAGAGSSVSGFTGDRGVSSRIENFMGAIESRPAPTTATRRDEFIVVTRWVLHGTGLFSPVVSTDQVSVSCPYKSSMNALAHINNLQIDILFQDLKENLFRYLSARKVGGNNNIANANVQGGIQVRLMGSQPGEKGPQLLAEYLRLPSYRGIPASINAQCFRAAVHTATTVEGTGTVAIPANVTRASIARALPDALPCVGFGRSADSRTALRSSGKYLTAEWKSLTSAQAPQYLAFVLQKSSSVLCNGGLAADDSVGRTVSNWNYAAGAVPAAADGRAAGLTNYMYARNQDSSASIAQFSLEIQSSIGAYTYSSESYPWIRSKHDLFRDHLKSCPDHYCSNNINIWDKHSPILLLGAQDWLRGLCTTNSSFPIQINAKVRFESHREFVDGHANAALGARSPAVFQDVIQGTPVCVQFFMGSSMQISPSSALLSSANLSHSQALDILSRQ